MSPINRQWGRTYGGRLRSVSEISPNSRSLTALSWTGPRNETRDSSFDDSVEADVRLYAISDLLHRVFRQCGKVKILPGPAGCDRGGEEGSAALHCPGQRN